MFEIKNLHVCVEGETKIIKGLNLSIPVGKFMQYGPNGSGKSTLSYVLAGREGYDVVEGEIWFKGEKFSKCRSMNEHEKDL